MSATVRLLANGLWWLASVPGALAFHQARRDVAGTQRRLLRRLLQANAATRFGLAHDFATIHTPDEFQARVPLSTHEEYRSHIAAIAAGLPNVLTTAPVLLLEPTSGSTAASKLIPYTAALKTEFQRALAPWVVDTFLHHPYLLWGAQYWSVSPLVAREARTAAGIPIGFEADRAYLGRQQRLVDAVLATPGAVKQVTDLATFRYVTLLFLLRSPRLAFISVWNPTFLTLLVEPLNAWWSSLSADIAQGTLTLPGPLDADLHAALARRLRPDPRRAVALDRARASATSTGDLHAALWPHLRVISCWADAQAAPYARRLGDCFPQATLQPKGLLATEGFVSLPLTGQAGAALAVRSHFFEFLPQEDGATSPRLAHKLDLGGRYAVVITTGGGLYRYQLQDVVEVTGRLGELPLLRFVGRADQVVDWFGEKLNGQHVTAALAHLLEHHRLAPAFAIIACAVTEQPPRYRLYIEVDAPARVLDQLAAELEVELCTNFHYAYCRQLGQLGPLGIFRIADGALDAYQRAGITAGQRAGDIKPVSLHARGDWSEVFNSRWDAD